MSVFPPDLDLASLPNPEALLPSFDFCPRISFLPALQGIADSWSARGYVVWWR
jgi:hypothetical protein